MNYRMIARFMSLIILTETVFMVPAAIIALVYGEMQSAYAFLLTIVIAAVVGAFGYFANRNAETKFYAREGYVCVGLSWIIMSLIGCLPFLISGEIPSFIDAYFETVSGFTTTGASILSDVEAMSHGMLYWRSFTHWLGGMGVLVFVLAVIPSSGKENGSGFTMHLLRAESPGPSVGKLVPRMRQTAKIMYSLYIVLTVACFVLLLIGGMSPFESICTAFGTAGTGGFGVKNDSLASYSTYIQIVCTVFMILFGVNFTCYYLMLLGKIKDVLKDVELRTYFGIIAASIVLITINVRNLFPNLLTAVQQVAFQVASIISTTGFATTDFDLWPTFSKTIILILMLCGASAGSTGGGFKVGRVILLVKSVRRNIKRILNPQKVVVVKNNGQVVSDKVLDIVNMYLTVYVFIILISLLIISIDGESMTTGITAVISCLNNIGPGLDEVGPTCNYAFFSIPSKIVLIIDMLAGRLEIFPILVLASRSTWRKMA